MMAKEAEMAWLTTLDYSNSAAHIGAKIFLKSPSNHFKIYFPNFKSLNLQMKHSKMFRKNLGYKISKMKLYKVSVPILQEQ